MRESCKECVLKHLAQAHILEVESYSDARYRWHIYLARGHLAEAEDEARSQWPEIADKIREARKSGEPLQVQWLINMVLAAKEGDYDSN